MEASPDVMRLMLRAADALADLVRAARDGGTMDSGRVQVLTKELQDLAARNKNANEVAAAENDDDFGDLAFAPLPVCFDVEPEASTVSDITEQDWTIRLKPQAELYIKANETALLMRELSKLGRLNVATNPEALPDLAELDPEGAYLTWTANLVTTASEVEIREIFEFVEGDCELEVYCDSSVGPTIIAAPQPSPALAIASEEASDDDIRAIINKIQATSEGVPAHPTEPPTNLREATARAPAVTLAADSPPPKTDIASNIGATIRVDLDRVDRLIDLVGELVINEAMLSQQVLEAGLARASGVVAALDELEQLTRGIQDSVMAIRAQPVRSVFQRMPRLVREVASMTGKQVRLLTDGEATEVDKTVIERIADPLTHMIRNAIDHGLESTEARLAAGKPAEGVVKLTALHRSGRIVIEVEDDGAGINRERVKAKAIEKGLIPADSQLTDEETDNLIFLPGFSTASEISDISGRGVGMDVVRRSVQALGGRISIASRPGAGSIFTLSFPLTLAVLDGMVVSVANHTLIVPLSAIIETLQPQAANVHKLGADAHLIAMRGGYVPLVDVGVALGYRAQPPEPEKSVALLAEGEGGIRVVLMVDAIQGQRQVVIKSLEANYQAVPGIAAATVMGDGRVALILDVDAVMSASRSEPLRADVPRIEPVLSLVD